MIMLPNNSFKAAPAPLNSSVRPSMSVPDSHWYELRNSVGSRNFSVAQALISSHPDILTSCNGIGETVLHFLAIEDDLEGVAWLHERGSDLDTRNEFGTPVLFEIAQLGYEKLFQWFIEHGANIRAIDSSNQGIVEYLQDFQEHEKVAFVRRCGA